MTRPSSITTTHMTRLAIGYGRTSASGQLERSTGSREDQLAQLRFPRGWGWAEHRVRWLDDMGLSGTVAERPGYRELRRLVRLGHVGVVCVSDITRLGRDVRELRSFLADCAAHGALLAVGGNVTAIGDSGS